MGQNVKKVMQEEYNRLKKVMEKLIKPKKDQRLPSLILAPVKNKKY